MPGSWGSLLTLQRVSPTNNATNTLICMMIVLFRYSRRAVEIHCWRHHNDPWFADIWCARGFTLFQITTTEYSRYRHTCTCKIPFNLEYSHASLNVRIWSGHSQVSVLDCGYSWSTLGWWYRFLQLLHPPWSTLWSTCFCNGMYVCIYSCTNSFPVI